MALWRKLKLKLKLSHSHQSQPWKRVLSSSSSSMRTHSLQNRTVLNYESLRGTIHSFLVGLPWSSTAFQLPTKCRTKSQRRRGRRRRRKHTHKQTHNAQEEEIIGSTDNQQRKSIRLILPSIAKVPAIQQKSNM